MSLAWPQPIYWVAAFFLSGATGDGFFILRTDIPDCWRLRIFDPWVVYFPLFMIFYKYINKILNGYCRIFATAVLSFKQYILES
jgi:hypothetical protein